MLPEHLVPPSHLFEKMPFRPFFHGGFLVALPPTIPSATRVYGPVFLFQASGTDIFLSSVLNITLVLNSYLNNRTSLGI
jgi:hypothetical protein